MHMHLHLHLVICIFIFGYDGAEIIEISKDSTELESKIDWQIFMGHSVVCLGGKDVHTELRDQFMPTASDILRCGFL